MAGLRSSTRGNTSQQCWQCGRTVPNDLSVRIQKMRGIARSRSTATSTRPGTLLKRMVAGQCGGIGCVSPSGGGLLEHDLVGNSGHPPFRIMD